MVGILKSLLVRGLLVAAAAWGLFQVFFLEAWPARDFRQELVSAGRLRADEELWVEVALQRMVLEVHQGDETLLRCDIGYGKGPIGRSGAESGTPLGDYRIIARERRTSAFQRGARFLCFDYPNENDADAALAGGQITPEDWQRIQQAHATGAAPPKDTPLGGPLGVQGNLFAFSGRGFTDGSIALDNGDLVAIFDLLPVGTRVVINDH
jgi:hypothetical protein